MGRWISVIVIFFAAATLVRAERTPSENRSTLEKLKETIARQEAELASLQAESESLRTLLGEAPPPVAALPAGATTAEKMAQVVPSVSFDGKPLNECLSFLKDAAKVEMEVNWKALEAAGIGEAAPVTVHGRNWTVKTALLRALDSAGGASVRLICSVEKKSVVVSTAEDLSRRTVTKTYDVTAMLANAASAQLATIVRERHMSGKAAQAEAAREAEETLMNVIRSTLVADTWKEAGGAIGEMRIDNNKLTITQSTFNIPQIELFLDQLKAGNPDEEIKKSKALINHNALRVSALRSDVANLKAKCRSAGKAIPVFTAPVVAVQPEKAMKALLPQAKFDGAPFSGAIDFLRDATGMNIFVNWNRIENIGVKRTTPVTLDLRNAPASEAIAKVLESASLAINPRFRREALAFDLDEGVVVISTAKGLDQNTVARFYDIGDVLPALTDAEERQLAKSIMQDAPDTWRENGGSTGSIQFFGPKMIVTQSNRVHRLIEAKLEAMRKAARKHGA